MKKLATLVGVLLMSAMSAFALPVTNITADVTGAGFGGYYIPLHNPLVEGIHNHEIPGSADPLNSTIGIEQIRTYVQVTPSDSLLSDGSIRFIIGNGVTIDDSLLTLGLGQPTGVVDTPIKTVDESFRLRLVNIYDFADILTLVDSSVYNSPGADFNVVTKDWNLPGGFNVDGDVEPQLDPYDLSNPGPGDPDYQWSFRPENSSPSFGMDAGEWASFSFLYSGSEDYNKFVMEIEKVFVGFHAQAFTTDDYSAAFYTHMPVAPVPEPGTLVLLGTGLLGLVAVRKKIKK